MVEIMTSHKHSHVDTIGGLRSHSVIPVLKSYLFDLVFVLLAKLIKVRPFRDKRFSCLRNVIIRIYINVSSVIDTLGF